MPRGRDFYGPGFWKGGVGPAPQAGGGRGRGNSSSFCRFFPWLPRRWWAASGAGAGAGLVPGYGMPDQAPDESSVLKQQAEVLQRQLNEINKRLEELDGQQ